MNVAHIDFETRSVAPLPKCGLEVYAEHPSTDALILCYAIGDGTVSTWKRGEPVSVLAPLFAHVRAGGAVYAHNAAFEYYIWCMLHRRHPEAWPALSHKQLHCTMAMARVLGLPAALADCAEALRLPVSKDAGGKVLINKLSKPNARTGVFLEDPQLLEDFAAYCRQDVEVERRLHALLPPLSAHERAVWELDFEINMRGVPIDLRGVSRALMVTAQQGVEDTIAIELATGGAVQTATQVAELVAWLEREGLNVEKLSKDVVTSLLRGNVKGPARAVLELRKQAAKTSAGKLEAMRVGTCADGRARGLLAYAGADTWRWAGRRIQTQNMPRAPEDFDGDFAVQLFRTPDPVTSLRSWYGEVMEPVAQSLRSLICASPGHDLISCDFSNIEGRVLAWLSRERWKVEAFEEYDAGRGHDLYKLAYAKSFGKQPEDVTKDERQIGKVQELALGYGGGVGAFASMAANYGIVVVAEGAEAPPGVNSVLTEAQTEEIKTAWRQAHPEIVRFWKLVENAAVEAVRHPGQIFNVAMCAFRSQGMFLKCRLPSGRALSYAYPSLKQVPNYGLSQDVDAFVRRVIANADGKADIADALEIARKVRDRLRRIDAAPLAKLLSDLTYALDVSELSELAPECDALKARCATDTRDVVEVWGKDKKSFDPETGKPTRKAWGPWRPYGGLFVENFTQAIARDLLAAAMLRLDAAGYPIIMHVHDEVVCEVPEGTGSVAEVKRIMCELLEWARGLPLAADGWRGKRFRK